MPQKLIEDGDTIILDTGTTTLELAKCLSAKRDLTIVLNDIEIASLLEESTQANLILIGGTLRHGFHCTVGPMAVSYLSELNVDKVFLHPMPFPWTAALPLLISIRLRSKKQ